MLKIAVCDDEQAICRLLSDMVRDYLCEKGLQGTCVSFDSYEQLQAHEEEFDLFLLDYKMPGVDGLEYARRLFAQYGEKKTIIFITAYPEIVYDAFEVRTYRFLVKPIQRDKLVAALDAYFEQFCAQHYLTVLSDGRTETIPVRDIYYIEVMGKYCTIVLAERMVQCKKTISAFEKELAPFDFFRVHRSYLINMHSVQSWNSRMILLNNGKEIFINPKKYADFRKAHIKLLK